MEIRRRSLVPVIYTELTFLRACGPRWFADCADDQPLLEKLKSVASGEECVSSLEESNEFIIKAQLPDDILERDGISEEPLEWRVYLWKIWDVQSLVTGCRPAEAVPPADVGITFDFLDALRSPKSCLPYLAKTEEAFTSPSYKGFHCEPKLKSKIEEIEKPLIARFKLAAMKHADLTVHTNTAKSKSDPQISAATRNRVLKCSKYRCLFCGKDSSMAKIEVNHIIPRSLIKKLQLDPALHTDRKNLCATCIQCNRSKSDNLAIEDIEYYRKCFSDPNHPNHALLVNLSEFAELQSL